MQKPISTIASFSEPPRDDCASVAAKTAMSRRLSHGQVARVDRPTSGVTILSVHVDVNTSFFYTPGQYINVLGKDGRFRSYSLARADVLDGCIELHVGRLAGGSFSDEAMRAIRTGDPLSWLGPYGEFAWHANAGKRAVFVCTGTGFAPVRALLERALGTAADTPITLYWGARKLADLYARALLRGWAREYPNFHFIPVLSEGVAIEGSSIRRGYVHQVVMDDIPSLDDAMVYACGSPRMVGAARGAFIEARGLPERAFFADPFGEIDPTLAPHIADGEGAQIRIDVGGVEYTVQAGGTLLQTLKRAGIPIQSVCGGQRACGTCLVEIGAPWRDRIAGPKREELDLLAFTPDAAATCRLACQIPLDPTMNGLAVRLR
jgi:CDP-4-dehydro-6-deoxyglucose reductase, E3